jgi:hypothetical protein
MDEPRPEDFGSTIDQFTIYANDQIMIKKVLKYVFVVLAFYVIPIFLFFIYDYEKNTFYYEIMKFILLGTIISFFICISFYYFTILIRLSTSTKYYKYSKSLRTYREWKREQMEISKDKEFVKNKPRESVSLEQLIDMQDEATNDQNSQKGNSYNVGYVDDH